MAKFDMIKRELERLMLESVSETDPVHSQLTLEMVLKLKPDADMALQIAALGHDIDRCFEARRVRSEDYGGYDEYKKHHASMSAEILCEILEKYDIDREIIAKVKYLVEHHEVGGDADADILRDADSLAFFEYNIPDYRRTSTLKETRYKIRFMYTRLSENAKQLVKQMRFEDKEVDELVRSTISDSY